MKVLWGRRSVFVVCPAAGFWQTTNNDGLPHDFQGSGCGWIPVILWNQMLRYTALLLFAASAFAAEGWRPLFNGENLDGWAVAGGNGGGYRVEDGAIRTVAGGKGLLWYAKEKIGNA